MQVTPILALAYFAEVTIAVRTQDRVPLGQAIVLLVLAVAFIFVFTKSVWEVLFPTKDGTPLFAAAAAATLMGIFVTLALNPVLTALRTKMKRSSD